MASAPRGCRVRLAVLASGSGGNAVVVEANGTLVLLDCGISTRQVERRMRLLGLDPLSLAALLITHEHGDHVRGAEVLQRRFRLPVLATRGTAAALRGMVPVSQEIRSGSGVSVGELTVLPVATSHDAQEPVGFVIEHGSCRVGLVTDTGVATPLLLERFSTCHGLLLESNHDVDLLRHGSYPWPLKQRIASTSGHLSNEQARDVVELLAHPELEVVVGMHLSRENNRRELAAQELARPLRGSLARVEVADQFEPMMVEVQGSSGGSRAGAAGPGLATPGAAGGR